MATITYYIRSHTDHVQQPLEHEAHGASSDEEWQKAVPRSTLCHSAPNFVPATVSYDDWCSGTGQLKEAGKNTSATSLASSVSGWYRSLTSSRDLTPSSRPESHSRPPSYQPLAPVAFDKNNWFIRNAIRSEPSCSKMPTPTLAEILARDPPPLPSEQKYIPPVWLEIGPSNKGFGMLQRAGWNEGEALGPDVARRKPLETMYLGAELFKAQGKADQKPLLSSILLQEMVETDENLDVTELRPIEVIDLSLESDDDAAQSSSPAEYGNDDRGEEAPPEDPSESVHTQGFADRPAYERKALLTPIATVLKSDRLGIGLKAKTVGPYKASQKRVTHNAAALAAHTQAAEEGQKRRQRFGRGRRGFERQHRREEERRKAMVAHLNGS